MEQILEADALPKETVTFIMILYKIRFLQKYCFLQRYSHAIQMFAAEPVAST